MSDLYEDTTGKVRGVYSEFLVFDGIVVCPDWFLDCYIIPGANAIVTAEGLENAAHALAGCGVGPEARRVRLARAVLEAAGIVVVDEVVEVGVEVGMYRDYIRFKYDEGDTLYIKRKEEQDG